MAYYLVNSSLYYLVPFNDRYYCGELLLKRGDCNKSDCYTKGNEETAQVNHKPKLSGKTSKSIGKDRMLVYQICKQNWREG